MSTPELATYIQTQLQHGNSADTIATQLREAGWQEADISAGFMLAQQSLSPTQAPMMSEVSSHQLPLPLKQSRFKTGWQLFKQSFSIIRMNPALWRYIIISTLITLMLFIILSIVFIFDGMNAQFLTYLETYDGDSTFRLTLLGFVVAFVWGILQTSVTFYYATGLTSHVLSLFKANATSYTENMRIARSKISAIATYATIYVVVGYLINLLQRIRFVGWILTKILDVIWSLATSFTIPLIADTSMSGAKATKESIRIFKNTWGETVVSRVSLGGAFFLIFYVIAIPATIVMTFLLSALFGGIGVLLAFILLILGVIIMAVIEALATNVLNAALYYYATYKVIPPNFSGELLASVYVNKKQK